MLWLFEICRETNVCFSVFPSQPNVKQERKFCFRPLSSNKSSKVPLYSIIAKGPGLLCHPLQAHVHQHQRASGRRWQVLWDNYGCAIGMSHITIVFLCSSSTVWLPTYINTQQHQMQCMLHPWWSKHPYSLATFSFWSPAHLSLVLSWSSTWFCHYRIDAYKQDQECSDAYQLLRSY